MTITGIAPLMITAIIILAVTIFIAIGMMYGFDCYLFWLDNKPKKTAELDENGMHDTDPRQQPQSFIVPIKYYGKEWIKKKDETASMTIAHEYRLDVNNKCMNVWLPIDSQPRFQQWGNEYNIDICQAIKIKYHGEKITVAQAVGMLGDLMYQYKLEQAKETIRQYDKENNLTFFNEV